MDYIGIFIEAGILLFINYTFFDNEKRNIISLITSRSASATDIVAILTLLVLSLGFIYWLGHFIVVRIWNFEASFGGGGPLNEHIIPFGALFFIVFFFAGFN